VYVSLFSLSLPLSLPPLSLPLLVPFQVTEAEEDGGCNRIHSVFDFPPVAEACGPAEFTLTLVSGNAELLQGSDDFVYPAQIPANINDYIQVDPIVTTTPEIIITCPDDLVVDECELPESNTSSVLTTEECAKPVISHVNDTTDQDGQGSQESPVEVSRFYKAVDSVSNLTVTCSQKLTLTGRRIICPADVNLSYTCDVPPSDFDSVTTCSDMTLFHVVDSDDECGVVKRTYTAKDSRDRNYTCTQRFWLPPVEASTSVRYVRSSGQLIHLGKSTMVKGDFEYGSCNFRTNLTWTACTGGNCSVVATQTHLYGHTEFDIRVAPNVCI
jgi:hypothetical protein